MCIRDSLKVDSILCEFKDYYSGERIDSLRVLMAEKEIQLFNISKLFEKVPVPVQYIYPDCIHCRDSVPDKDTVRTGEVHDTHHHHGVRGGVLQLKLFHVRSDCDVPVRSPGVRCV